MSDNKATDTPWINPGQWFVSPHNFAPEVLKNFHPQKRVNIYDVTLRDGEQQPGVVFRTEEKLRIAHALFDMGVRHIESGMVAVSPEDADAAARVAKELPEVEVASLARTTKNDIDAALRCGVKRVTIEVMTADDTIKLIWGSVEKAVDSFLQVATYAKQNGLYVNLFLSDGTRATMQRLRDFVVPIAKEKCIDSVAIVDTFGCATPWGFGHLVSELRKMSYAPVEAHCHDTWGFGTANTIAAITAGATTIHTAVNGLNGNASLDECVMAAKALIGVETGIKTEGIFELSKMVKEYSKSDWYKPFLGWSANKWEAGIPTGFLWQWRETPEKFYTMLNLEMIGRAPVELVIGKKSGGKSIRLKAYLLKMEDPGDERAAEILGQVKRLSEEKKGEVTDDEFRKIYTQVMSAAAA
jgi:isopropylmalate/homocitrate/citramalate synthase